jgi:dTDP-glucose 4,6-dehydratase
MSFHRSFDTPVAIIRPFNTYGPRQSARAFIPTVITQIASGARRIRLGALHPTRDLNYVADTVSGFLAVAECDASVGEVINVGSNYEISMGDTARMIAELMRADVDILTDPERLRPVNSEVERLWADTAKAQRLLNLRPEYAGKDGLRRGLAETVEWFVQPHNLSAYKSSIYNI